MKEISIKNGWDSGKNMLPDRLTIISLVDIKDPTETVATENRLLRNTKDMAEVCRMFYGEEAAAKLG